MKTSDWIIDDSESVERKQNNNEQQIMTHVYDSYNSLFGLQETDWFAHANYQILKLHTERHLRSI